jgi:hypothetical protein
VFPRNQYNGDYIEVCRKYGITSFSTEKSLIYKSSNSGEEQLFIKKALRLIDTYINITGYHCYGLDKIKESFLIIFLQVVFKTLLRKNFVLLNT